MRHFINVDNPGLGNCAFYSFSIALIDVIKHEHHKHGHSPTFNRWCESSPEIRASQNEILNHMLTFNYKRQNRELLDILQVSLRNMLYRARYEQLSAVNLRNQTVYNHFAEIVRNSFNGIRTDPNYNDLAHSTDIVRLANSLANRLTHLHRWVGDSDRQKWESVFDEEVCRIFKKDVYNNHVINEDTSVIVKGIQKIKQNFHWGTHSDLNQLAGIFNVNFHCLVNGVSTYPFRDEPEKPVITINNQYGIHWTTRIETLTPAHNATKVYLTSSTDSVLSKKEICHIFESYVGGFIAFFSCRRHHNAKAKEIILACKDNKTSVETILTMIQEYTNNSHIYFNPDGDFMKRVNYILGRHNYYNGVAVKLGVEIKP